MIPFRRAGALAPGVLRILLLVFLSAALPHRGASQGLTLTELESAYRAARLEYEAARETLDLLASQNDRAVAEFHRFRNSGDEERRDAAFAQQLALAKEIRSQNRRVEELEAQLSVARRQYREALGNRLDSLLAARDAAPDSARQRTLAIQATDANNRYQELLSEEGDPGVPEATLPTVTRDLRDGPEELRQKAIQEEFRAEQLGTVLEEIGRRLEELRKAQFFDRNTRDFFPGLGRFGDTNLPVGPGNRNPTQRPVATDSTGAGPPLTLEERIQNLEIHREVAEELIRQYRANAAQYRVWARGGGA